MHSAATRAQGDLSMAVRMEHVAYHAGAPLSNLLTRTYGEAPPVVRSKAGRGRSETHRFWLLAQPARLFELLLHAIIGREP